MPDVLQPPRPISEPEPPQPQPGEPSPPPARVPNLGHALLFLALAALFLILVQGLLFAIHPPAQRGRITLTTVDPRLLLGSQAVAYIATLLASAALFARLWKRPFLSGVQWGGATARRQALRLVPLGFALAIVAQGALLRFAHPKDLPIEKIFDAASSAWLATFFGSLVAPAFEEIAFRGFLLPSLAIAYDWLSLPRDHDAHTRWRASTSLTPLALLFSAILSSLLFVLLHGQQLVFLVPAMLVLFCVSLVLSLVRIRTQSVACSAVVHAAYNGFVFLAVLVQTGGYRHLERLASK
ncbi:MAG: CPBP family intramembrane metalloprotease [Acidobacteriota bacterium]|nr:CPBP family intramembrane metalloprotease [Acidobacteriota bacterium]